MSKCRRCRKKEGVHWWDVQPCAAGRKVYAWLCDDCDIELNEYTLSFFRVAKKNELMTAYRKKVLG